MDEKQTRGAQMRTNANTSENDGEISDAGLRRKVEERAYQIWLENGGGHGAHELHWLQAERELVEARKRAAIRYSFEEENRQAALNTVPRSTHNRKI